MSPLLKKDVSKTGSEGSTPHCIKQCMVLIEKCETASSKTTTPAADTQQIPMKSCTVQLEYLPPSYMRPMSPAHNRFSKPSISAIKSMQKKFSSQLETAKPKRGPGPSKIPLVTKGPKGPPKKQPKKLTKGFTPGKTDDDIKLRMKCSVVLMKDNTIEPASRPVSSGEVKVKRCSVVLRELPLHKNLMPEIKPECRTLRRSARIAAEISLPSFIEAPITLRPKIKKPSKAAVRMMQKCYTDEIHKETIKELKSKVQRARK